MVNRFEQALKLVRERNIPVGPRLTEQEIAGFEREHSIQLPEEYRWFLQNIGACCVGLPSGGLLPLDAPWNLWGQREQWSILPSLSKPFPFTQTHVWGKEERPWDFWVENVWAGSLFLGSDGCIQGHNLIVSGPERGHMWEFTQFGIYATEPRETFLTWFVRWAKNAREQWLEARRRRPEVGLLTELRRRGWRLSNPESKCTREEP